MNTIIRRIFTWRKILVAVVIFLITTPVIFVARISSSNSVVTEVGSLDVSSSAKAKALALRLRKQIFFTSSLEELSATQDEINGLIQLAMRGFPRLAGRANVTSRGLEIALVLHVPENPFGEYINIRAGLLPSTSGLRFSHSSIGKVQFSGKTTLVLFRYFLNKMLADKQASLFISAIETVAVHEREVTITFHPIPDYKNQLRRSKERYREIRDDLALLGDPAVVRLYYERLCGIDSLHRNDMPVSLAWYTAAVFDLAKERTQSGNDVIVENRAAIIALGIFLGSRRIETLVGTVRTGELKECKNNPRYVVLANRRDLRLHFVISAVLKVISDSGMSSAAGEFKELLDAGRGGSGFSFVDLAADIAGVKFAERLLDNTSNAWRAQEALAGATDESVFFPSIDGLPENLSQEQFEFKYGGLQDPRYQSMVTEIENRLALLPIYTG